MKARVVKITIASDSGPIERWAAMYRKHIWSRWVFADFDKGESDIIKEIQSLEVSRGIKTDMEMVDALSGLAGYSTPGKEVGPCDKEYYIYAKDRYTPSRLKFFRGLRDEDFEIPGLYRTREQAVRNGVVRILTFDVCHFTLKRIEFLNPDTGKWEAREDKCYWTDAEALKNIYWEG